MQTSRLLFGSDTAFLLISIAGVQLSTIKIGRAEKQQQPDLQTTLETSMRARACCAIN